MSRGQARVLRTKWARKAPNGGGILTCSRRPDLDYCHGCDRHPANCLGLDPICPHWGQPPTPTGEVEPP